jgi:RNA polymerase primary sigma factor
MSPAATKTAKPDIVLLANSEGEVREVAPEAETKKAPARRSSSKASAKDLTAAADELLAAADPKKAEAAKAAPKSSAKKSTAKSATAKKPAAKKATAKKASSKTGADAAAAPANAVVAKPEIVLSPEEKAKAIAAEKAAKAKALASIKIGPKGVYTEDSIRVYLLEIGRIRLLRPDVEIELELKIADLLHLEELAAQF